MIRLSNEFTYRSQLLEIVERDYCNGRDLYKFFSKRAVYLGVPRQDFSDVFQNFILGLCQRTVGYNPEAGKTIRNYLSGCFSNSCRDYLRRRGAKKRNKKIRIPQYQEIDPQEQAENNEEIERVQNAIKMLSSEQRELIIQHYYEGVTAKELAERTSKSESSVKRELALLRKKLRRLLIFSIN